MKLVNLREQANHDRPARRIVVQQVMLDRFVNNPIRSVE
jgi:hypothetical protein